MTGKNHSIGVSIRVRPLISRMKGGYMPIIEQEKINIIHKYLEEEFPECTIRVGYDFERMDPKFMVFSKAENYCAIINKSFINDHGKEEINAWLHNFELPQKLSDYANRSIIINHSGNFTVE